MKRIAILQAGGPTQVLNASLAGFVNTAKQFSQLVFVQGGYEGLAKGDFYEADEKKLAWVQAHRGVPGACLASGRFPLNEQALQQSLHHLKEKCIDTVVGIGGNGTMAALQKLSSYAAKDGMSLQVAGIPKTVDNDIGCTDHAPGFGSAARYVAASVRDMSRDLLAMKNFEKIRILETMGRHTGWLAAASGLLRDYEEEGPHFIGLPEVRTDPDELCGIVSNALSKHGCALLVVSEGMLWDKTSPVARAEVNGRQMLGGVSQAIAEYLGETLNVNGVRSELLGMNQRSLSLAVSDIDRKEAYEVGEQCASFIESEKTGFMVSILRQDSYTYTTTLKAVPLQRVAEYGEQCLPARFITHHEEYSDWLRPLVGEGLKSYPAP
ncbi:diphosphate--fructose-6-phosphate 1-phosphotransferase [Aureibacillus halotolerans]|uniref:6-phosphofructokinase 1 n=1 Tax=Aureibacillus halotolerans TaxID=1508390 RepID=A0A4R6U627_9BACI|nr:diphosphate--fructose-6-phosphate 1-phosphotransferase [Aureibacillus halotolerans]TDQ41216.1 6-phosphofructokinase 1 [Aureibacillus halotolerans]